MQNQKKPAVQVEDEEDDEEEEEEEDGYFEVGQNLSPKKSVAETSDSCLIPLARRNARKSIAVSQVGNDTSEKSTPAKLFVQVSTLLWLMVKTLTQIFCRRKKLTVQLTLLARMKFGQLLRLKQTHTIRRLRRVATAKRLFHL